MKSEVTSPGPDRFVFAAHYGRHVTISVVRLSFQERASVSWNVVEPAFCNYDKYENLKCINKMLKWRGVENGFSC